MSKKKKKSLLEQAFDSIRNKSSNTNNISKQQMKIITDENGNISTLPIKEKTNKLTGVLGEELEKKFNTNNLSTDSNGNITMNNVSENILTGKTNNIDKKSAYDQLVDYKKSNNINLFNENSKRVKNDKTYQTLLKNAQLETQKEQDKKEKEIVQDYNFQKGIVGGLEKTSYALAGGFEKGLKGIENTTLKILGQTPTQEETKEGILEKLSSKARQETKGVAGYGLDIAGSIGQMIPQITTGGPTASTITGFANYGGSAYNEAKNEGKTEKQATTYGIVSGTLEMAMEKALGGFENIYGKKIGETFSSKIISKVIKNKALRKTIDSAKGEFTEEYLQQFLEPILKNAILEEDNGADFWNTAKDDLGEGIKQGLQQFFNKENLTAGVLGAVTSGIMEGPQNVAKNNWSKQTGRDYDTGYTKNEQKVIDKLIEDRIKEATENGKKELTSKDKNKIENEVKKDLENGQIDIDTIENALGKQEYIDKLKNDSEMKLARNLTEQEISDITKEAIDKFNNETDLSKDDYLLKSYEEKQKRQKEFIYDSNQKMGEYAKATYESTKGKMNDTIKSHNMADAMAKISEDRQMAYKFTNNEELRQKGLLKEGKTANGVYVVDNNGQKEILVNLDSKKYLEQILVHETTHDMENDIETYDALKKITTDFAKTKGDYEKIRKEIESNYEEGTNIESETTARLLEDYLGNKDFVNELTNQKPTIVQKIIDTIKYLKKQFNADSNEARKLNKMQFELEQAYKEAYNKINNINLESSFSEQVEQVKNGTFDSNNHLIVSEHTPKVLQQLGVKDLPITLTARKLERIMNETGNQKGEYHALGDLVKKIPEAINTPLDIIKSHNDSYVLTTDLSDKQDRSIIVSIKIDGKGYKNNIEIDTNVMTSAYGRNNYENWMNEHLKNGNIVYDIDRGFINNKKPSAIPRLQLPSNNTKFVDNNISQNDNIVNNSISNKAQKDTKYSLNEESENNVDNKLSIEKNKSINDKVERVIQKGSYKAINIATKTAKSYLDFDYQEKKAFKESLNKFYGKTKDELINADTYKEVRDMVNQYANREYTYIDEQVESIKKQIKNSKLKIDDNLKQQITDYNDFRKESKLKLGKEGQSIDSLYQELSNMYPYYFSNEITGEADMLYELSNFMNQDNTITEKYKLSDSDLKFYSDKIYNSLVHNSVSEMDINELQKQLEKKVERRTRKVVQQELLNKMGITINDFQIGNDISSIEFQITDPVRVNEKVFGYEMGTKINDVTINFTKHQEAERTRWLNKERDEIKELGIKPRSKESSAVQKYAEKMYVDENGVEHEYGDKELQQEFSNVEIQEKIKQASKILRNKYDRYIDEINNVLTELGYDAIPKRKDYMRHFEELTDKLSQWGVPFNRNDMLAEDLPTDINGLTDMNRPGKNYFASANQRTGLKTIYDAITGIDGYLEGASNLIFHTESIQRYRAVTRLVRESYGREHGLDDIDLLTDAELQERIDDIRGNKLSKYVAWLDEQANALAGKKGTIDRGVERFFGRKVYTALNTLKSQVGSNMVGFNLRTPLTNFASVVQGASKTEKVSFLKGTVSTINNIFQQDELINKSDFLTSRFGSDSLSPKLWQKISNAGQILMTGSDYFTANQIWRSKYYENLHNGMTEEMAIKKADDFSAKIMGDRTKGATAEMFNSKTLGFLTQFQLETNNQWSSMIHDNKMAIESGEKTTAGVLFSLGQLFACSSLFNLFMDKIGAGDVMFDPINMLMKLFKDDDKSMEDKISEIRNDIIGQIPMGNLISESGRLPISEALPIKQLLYGKDSRGNPKSRGETLIETLPYYLLPGGYGQIKKTTKGLSMYDDKLPVAGSYTKSGNLRFTADDSPTGILKSALFGQYSGEEAKKYIDSGFKSIPKSKIEELKELNMKSSEYREYRQGLSEAGTKRKDKIEYINNLDVSNKKKSIMASNVLKKYVDMSKYNKYGSYEEFDYAMKNPEKYKMISNIMDFNDYQKITKHIKEISGTIDKSGKTISGSRKKSVIEYVNSLDLSIPQKAMLIKQEYSSFNQYDKQIINYVNSKDLSIIDKASILKRLGFKQYDKQIINYANENYSTTEEKIKFLKKLGFTTYEVGGKTFVRTV